MVDLRAGQRLLDPCCGSGTILIEAALSGARAAGGDLDSEAVAAAQANAHAAGVTLAIEQWDAKALPLPDRSIERIVTNLPWGRQVALDEDLANLYAGICGELERVLTPGGRIALLTSAPELLRFESPSAERNAGDQPVRANADDQPVRLTGKTKRLTESSASRRDSAFA